MNQFGNSGIRQTSISKSTDELSLKKQKNATFAYLQNRYRALLFCAIFVVLKMSVTASVVEWGHFNERFYGLSFEIFFSSTFPVL